MLDKRLQRLLQWINKQSEDDGIPWQLVGRINHPMNAPTHPEHYEHIEDPRPDFVKKDSEGWESLF